RGNIMVGAAEQGEASGSHDGGAGGWMRRIGQFRAGALCCAVFAFAGCKSNADAEKTEKTQPPFTSSVAVPPAQFAADALPADKPGIILLGTHYDTLKKDNFVGADDAGSSTGIMLEFARLLCARHGKYAVWIAFFDGEEAVQTWSDTDSRYGSREMAAKLAISGDLKRVRAFLLADIVGGKNARIPKEADSTPELSELVYETAKRF